MIWLAMAVMTAAVVLALVWPLAHRRAGGRPAGASDLAFYRSQLAELEGDVARGALDPAEAAPTRAEIGRRLLAAARAPAAPAGERPSGGGRAAAVGAAVLGVPAVSLIAYLVLGHPEAPDMPLAGRNVAEVTDLAAALPRIEAHLVAYPEDGRGFALIAPVYLRLGRADDAARAYRAALRILGDDPGRQAGLGQALVLAADGVVTDEARAAFEAALKRDPATPAARFFLALAAEQDGDGPRALGLWRALQADTDPAAPWRAGVDAHVAALSGAEPREPGAEQAAAGGVGAQAIAGLPPAEQRAAITGMVDGLAARLARNGRDRDGWLRLIRAYKVLGEDDKARGALADARKGLEGDDAALARVGALGRELGLEG